MSLLARHKSTAIEDRRAEKVIGNIWLLLLLLPVTTLFQSLPGLSSLNQIIIAIVTVLLLTSFFVTRYELWQWLIMLLSLISSVIALLFTEEAPISINDLIYLPFWTILLCCVSSNINLLKRIMLRKASWCDWVTGVWCFIVAVSALFPSSYQTSWGGDSYFMSITGDSFRLCPAAYFILLLLTFRVATNPKKRQWYLIQSLVPLFCAFMAGSRTYFVVILGLYLVFLWFYCNDLHKFRLFVAFAIIICVALFGSTGIASKVASTTYTSDSYFDFWGTLTNGRSIMWAAQIDAVINGSFFQLIMGSGLNQIYYINFDAIGALIWAHNDFLNLMVTNGIAGLVAYLVPLFVFYRTRYKASENADKKMLFLMAVSWLFNAFYNMTYTYTCTTLVIAFFPLVLYANTASVVDQADKKYF